MNTGESKNADPNGLVSFSNVPLVVGNNVIQVEVTDRTGNSARRSINVRRTIPDTSPPVLDVMLIADTGLALDRLTSDPRIQGTVLDASRITTLRAAIDTTDSARFVDILPDLNTDGKFILTKGRLQQIAGGILSDGQHIVDNGFAVLTLSTPGIHRVVIRGTSTTAFDDFSFNEVYPAQLYEYKVRSVDPDNDNLTYTLTTAPFGMTIDGSGLIRWPVASLNVGTPRVTVRVDDGRHGFDNQTFVISPTTTAAKISGKVFNDLDGDGVIDGGENGLIGRTVYLDQSRNFRRDPGEHFAVTNANGDYAFDGLSQGSFTIRLERNSDSRLTSPEVGAIEVNLVDGQILSGQNFGSIESVESNVKPVFTSTPQVDARVSHEFIYNATAMDANLDPLLFDAPVGPDGIVVDPETGIVVWTPSADQVGVHDVVLRASDGRGGVSLQSLAVEVSATQTAPVFTTPPPQAPSVVGQSYLYQFRAQDVVQQTIKTATKALSISTFVDTARGVYDFLTLGIFALSVASEVLDGLDKEFTVAKHESENSPGSIKAIELKLILQDGEDRMLALEMEIKDKPKVKFNLNLTHPEKSEIEIELGKEFRRKIADVKKAGLLPILELDLVLETKVYPSASAALGIEGTFAGVLKGKFSLIEFGG